MTKIDVCEDCGNAPKKLYLKNFVVSVVTDEKAVLSESLTDDITWNVVGHKNTSGKLDVISELLKSRHKRIDKLTINTIVTHGYDGVVEGELKFNNGNEIAFCDIYKFSSPRNNSPIKAIKTYLTSLK